MKLKLLLRILLNQEETLCLLKKEKEMFEDLKAKVAANTVVISSAVTLIQGLKAKLDAAIAANDPAALAALSAELGTADQSLADAVVANTPAA